MLRPVLQARLLMTPVGTRSLCQHANPVEYPACRVPRTASKASFGPSKPSVLEAVTKMQPQLCFVTAAYMRCCVLVL